MHKKHHLPLGDISVNFVRIILNSMRELGVSPTELEKRYRLDHAFLNTPGARISIPKYMRIGHDAIRATHKAELGLIAGQNTDIADIALAGLSAIIAPTLGEALAFLIDMESLNSRNSRGRSRYIIEDGRAVCQFYSISPYNAFNYFVVDNALSTWWKFIKTYAAGQPKCHHIEIEYENQRYQHYYEKLFDCPVYYGAQRNALILKREHQLLPMTHASVSTFAQMSELCHNEKQQIIAGKTTSDLVIDLISAQLSGSPPQIEDVARQLGIAGWTLRRRLADENIKFQDLLDNTRSALAQTYVKDSQHNFTEIAFLLGFSSPSAFQRAFKRWTSFSPGDYRKLRAEK
jgi:AraC-like DNA-binding protein